MKIEENPPFWQLVDDGVTLLALALFALIAWPIALVGLLAKVRAGSQSECDIRK